MSQRQAIPEGFNIYKRLYLKPNGHPNCIKQQKGALDTDLDNHIIHLRSRDFSERDRLDLNDAILVVQENGLVEQERLKELLRKGNPKFSRRCCGPEASSVGKRTKTRVQTPVIHWELKESMYSALFIEKPPRGVNRLQRFPCDDVKKLAPGAIQARLHRRGPGVRKDQFLTAPDVKYIEEQLTKEMNPSGQKRSPDSGLQEPRKKIRREEPVAGPDTTTPPEGSTILVNDGPPHTQEPQSQPTIISDDSESESQSDEQEGNALFFSLAEESLQSLMKDRSVDSETMFALLQFIQLVVDPTTAWCVNPDHIRASRWPDWATILCPVRVEEHWIVVRITRPRQCVIFDPQPQGEHQEKRVSRAAEIYKQALGTDLQGSPKYSAPIVHGSSHDSGVLAIMTIICLVLDITVDPGLDVACCRRMLLSIISGSPVSLQDASHCANPDTTLNVAPLSTSDVRNPQLLMAWTRERSSEVRNALSMLQEKRAAMELETQWTPWCLGLIKKMIEQSSKLSNVPPMVGVRLSQASEVLLQEKSEYVLELEKLGESITLLESLAGALESCS